MNLGNLFSGDLLALFGGSVGGLLSGQLRDPDTFLRTECALDVFLG